MPVVLIMMFDARFMQLYSAPSAPSTMLTIATAVRMPGREYITP